MKKILLCFLLAALVLSLAACKNKGKLSLPLLPDKETTTEEPTTEEPTTEEPTTEEPTTEEPTSMEPEMAYEDQIAFLAANYSKWVKTDPAVPYSYAVTDLDRNGRLEVVASVCMGTGFFTYTEIWEINETFDGLTYSPISEDETSQADIIVPSLTAYEREGEYCYIVADYIRSGYAYNAETVFSLRYQAGICVSDLLAYRETEVTADYEELTAYYTADGETISEAEYTAIPQEYFTGCPAYTVTLGWQSFYEDEIFVMDAAAWQEALLASWNGFSFTAAE